MNTQITQRNNVDAGRVMDVKNGHLLERLREDLQDFRQGKYIPTNRRSRIVTVVLDKIAELQKKD